MMPWKLGSPKTTPRIELVTIFAKILNRLRLYAVRLNRFLIFSNQARMTVYRRFIGMSIGKDSMIWAGNRFNDPTNMEIGDNCAIGPNNLFLSRGGIKIGRNVNLSGFGFFISQQHDLRGDDFTRTTTAPIIIEDRAWVATNCTIMPGVTIHEGGVVAAGSVVVKDVPAWTVVGGNPARVIGQRSHQTNYEIKDLRGLKWL